MLLNGLLKSVYFITTVLLGFEVFCKLAVCNLVVRISTSLQQLAKDFAYSLSGLIEK